MWYILCVIKIVGPSLNEAFVILAAFVLGFNIMSRYYHVISNV